MSMRFLLSSILLLVLLAPGCRAAFPEVIPEEPGSSNGQRFTAAFPLQPLPRRVCNAACQRAQRAALLQLHARLGGAGWENAEGYGTDVPHCSFFGVLCCRNFTRVSNAYLASGVLGAF